MTSGTAPSTAPATCSADSSEAAAAASRPDHHLERLPPPHAAQGGFELLERALGGEQGARVELAAGEQRQGAGEGRRPVVVGALHGDLRVVQAVGVERHVGPRRAAAEELDEPARADRGEGVLPGGGGAGRPDGDGEAVAGARAAAEAGGLPPPPAGPGGPPGGGGGGGPPPPAGGGGGRE